MGSYDITRNLSKQTKGYGVETTVGSESDETFYSHQELSEAIDVKESSVGGEFILDKIADSLNKVAQNNESKSESSEEELSVRVPNVSNEGEFSSYTEEMPNVLEVSSEEE